LKRAVGVDPAARLFRIRKKSSISRDSRLPHCRKLLKNGGLLPN
jgi:hypothetical protein